MLVNNISQEDLRSLAERSLQVFERTRHADVGLPPFEKTLVPAANNYIAVYDEARRYQASKKSEVAHAATAFADLQKRIRVWLGTLAQDLPDFDASAVVSTPGVPDKLLADAKRLIDQAQDAGEAMPFAKTLIADLSVAMEAAQKQWTESQAAQAKLQALQAAVREAATTLHRQLVAFRRTLRASLGSTNQDYRRLLFPRREPPPETPIPNPAPRGTPVSA
jgi:hypothetical protein